MRNLRMFVPLCSPDDTRRKDSPGRGAFGQWRVMPIFASPNDLFDQFEVPDDRSLAEELPDLFQGLFVLVGHDRGLDRFE